MIGYNQLVRYAKESGASLGVFEKDYIISCALAALSKTDHLTENLIFKGGTALRKVYFPDWRYSEDLDFSVLPAFEKERLKPLIEEWFNKIYQETEISMSIKDFHKANGAARLRAQFTGPLRHPNLLLFDITLDEPIIIAPQKRPIFKPFEESPEALISVYSLEEILAEKLRSILQRGKSRDYYDVWRLLKENQDLVDLKIASDIFQKKCLHKGIEITSLTEFTSEEKVANAQRYWDEDLRSQIGELSSFSQTIRELKELLSILPL